uniref:Protein FAR1-RELATED SEQUENCE n=1 Tax=Lactuca sativa TaxID=4236 RepID=A0A9R1VP07_LACSA|nr:hypothetical protein LSAT_V11C400219920 [Lactuca sativa]
MIMPLMNYFLSNAPLLVLELLETMVKATYESEELNDFDVNIEFDKDNDNVEKILGKVFDTPDEAYTFYYDYSFLHGFGIYKDDTVKSTKTNEPYWKYYVCCKVGFKWVDKNDSSGNEKKHHRDVRTGCQAKFRIAIQEDGKWLMDIFNDTHNNKLTMKPTEVIKHRSHSNFHRSIEGKSLMVQFGHAGLKPSQIKKAVNTMKSINVADDKTLVDNDQYFVVDLSDDGYPRKIFWVDGRSRDAYAKFKDVVVLDVTYMNNTFKMPFAPFTGVNHHGQSILFRGALLENEKEETFEWLFEHFLKCMFGKYPKAIITDQDKAMGNAIKQFFQRLNIAFVHGISCSMKLNTFDRIFPITVIFKKRTDNR